MNILDENFVDITEKNKVRKININVEFAFDIKFFAILPALNINFHSKTIEFEWLCFAVYFDKADNDNHASH